MLLLIYYCSNTFVQIQFKLITIVTVETRVHKRYDQKAVQGLFYCLS